MSRIGVMVHQGGNIVWWDETGYDCAGVVDTPPYPAELGELLLGLHEHWQPPHNSRCVLVCLHPKSKWTICCTAINNQGVPTNPFNFKESRDRILGSWLIPADKCQCNVKYGPKLSGLSPTKIDSNCGSNLQLSSSWIALVAPLGKGSRKRAFHPDPGRVEKRPTKASSLSSLSSYLVPTISYLARFLSWV